MHTQSMLTVYKLDVNGRCVWQYPAQVAARSARHVKLEALFNRDEIDLGFTSFKRGDRFVEYFYSDRWYNIFVVYDHADAKLKGWYCNICRPAELAATAVRCDDLGLDVWVNPDGAAIVLDVAEFEALNLNAEEQRNGRAALQALLEMARRQQLPA